MSKVVAFGPRGAGVGLCSGVAVPELVVALEGLLEEARAGKVVALAFVIVRPGEVVSTWSAESSDLSPWPLMAGASMLMDHLKRRLCDG